MGGRFVRKAFKDARVAFLDRNRKIDHYGTVLGVRTPHKGFPEIDVQLDSEFFTRTYKIVRGIRWDRTAKHLELEPDDVVESTPGRTTDLAVESRHHRPGNREEVRSTPQHGQSAPSEAGPSATTNGGSHGESARGVRPGHDANPSSESKTGRADTPGTDTISGDPGHTGAVKPFVFRMGVNDGIPDGVLIGAAPDQTLHITTLPSYVGGFPENTIIWGSSRTIESIRTHGPTTRTQ